MSPGFFLAVYLAFSFAADETPADPIPQFTGDRLYSSSPPEMFAAVAQEIERIDAESPQAYYVVVVESLGTGKNAGSDYIDRLAQDWRRQAREKGLSLDEDHAVIVVLAMTIRQIAVQPGRVLRDKYSLTPEYLETVLVPKHFIPLAKAGRHDDGLIALLHAIEEHIAANQPSAEAPLVQDSAPVAAESPTVPALPAASAEEPRNKPLSRGGRGTSPATKPRSSQSSQAVPLIAGTMGALLLLICGLVAIALLIVGLFCWRLRWKTSVRRRFEVYRERVVQLSDMLDALKERHKLLPHLDRDFAEPMTGQTEALYQSAQAALEEYRNRWLDLMSAWERTKSLLEEESWWGVGRYREAEKTMKSAGVEQELTAIHARCAEPLARLEQGHEQAAGELAAADERLRRWPARLGEIERAQLPSEPYQRELGAIGALVEKARSISRQDPIGALDFLHQAEQRGEGWEKWIQAVLELRERADQLQRRLEEASAAAGVRRAGGYLFCEPNCDPFPLLEEARRKREEAIQALRQGEPRPAAELVTRACRAVEEANAIVERTEQAKARCEKAMAGRGVERSRLEDEARRAREHRKTLDSEFAGDSWREAEEKLSAGISSLSIADAAFEESASLASSNVQHYLRAAALVERAEQECAHAQSLLAAPEQRLGELVALRRRCRDELLSLRRRIEGLADILRRGETDRPAANDRYRDAQRLLEDTCAQSEQPRADWPRIQPRLAEVARLAEESQRLAQDDFQLAALAKEKIASARREIDEAQGFSQMGLSADASAASQTLHDARRRLRDQEYEDAIRLADRAGQEAQRARADAQRLAQRKQAELDEERRRVERVARQAASAVGIMSVESPPPAAPPQSSTPPAEKRKRKHGRSKNSSQNSW